MTLRFDLTDAEFAEYQKYFYKKRVTWRTWLYLSVAILLFGFKLYKRHAFDEGGTLVLMVSGIELMYLSALFGAIWFYALQFISRSRKLKAEDKEIVLGEREITFGAHQIEAKEAHCESIYYWKALKKWEQTQNLYLLFLTDDTAILVPKRVFKSTEEQAEFEQLLGRIFTSLNNEKYLDA
jgi:hypothetical protein